MKPTRELVKPTNGTYYEGADFVSFRTERCAKCKGIIGPERHTSGHLRTYGGKWISASYCSADCYNASESDANGCVGLWTRELGVVPDFGSYGEDDE